MKTFFLCSLLFCAAIASDAQVAINTTNTAADGSAMLDVSSANKGILIPRMFFSAAPTNPAASLLVFFTDKNQYYFNSGTQVSPVWSPISGVSNWSLNGNAGVNPATQFLGNTDDVPLVLRVNNQQAGRFGNSLDNNLYLGNQAGVSSGINLANVGIGYQALFSNTSGSSNTAIGFDALHYNTTGFYNTANGGFALYYNTTGTQNTANGYHALIFNQTGNNNTANGYEALRSNQTGSNNTATGQALFYNTTGSNNVATGENALYYNTIGNNNTANGNQALNANTTGNNNTANGSEALRTNQTGSNNLANGYQALYVNQTGNGNIANGDQALNANTTGDYNTASGYSAGIMNISGSNNTYIGSSADGKFSGLTNSSAFGAGAIVDASNKIRLGDAHVTVIEGQVAFSYPSDLRLKKDIQSSPLGLDFINRLRPVQYVMKNDATGRVQDGFIAQEVEGVMGSLGVTFSGLNRPADLEKGHYSLAYSTFVVPLTKAVQELDAKNKELQQENERLNKEITALKAATAGLDQLKADVANIKASLERRQASH